MVLASTDDVQRITPAEAKALVDGGRAVLYDTRAAEAYRIRHAAGAVSLPEAEVPGRLDELPSDKALIFYCT
jgi:rhodanese-related sulfurtransferase